MKFTIGATSSVISYILHDTSRISAAYTKEKLEYTDIHIKLKSSLEKDVRLLINPHLRRGILYLELARIMS